MAIGDRWRLPDGRDAIETGRTARLLRVVPLHDGPPFMGVPYLVWREECTLLPSRYLHGQIPDQPGPDDLAPDTPTTA